MEPAVLLRKSGRIAHITLNRPESLNALAGEVVEALVEHLNACQQDEQISCIILTGAGKAFSSGGNLREIKALTAEQNLSPLELAEWYRSGIQRIPQAMEVLDVPVIAAVNGHAIGAGCDLATMADIRIAGESAIFAESFLRVGIIPGDGGAWFLPRVIGFARASQMLLTAEMINADKAAEWGLVSEVVADGELLSKAEELAEKISAQPPITLRKAKGLLRATQAMSLEDSLHMAALYQGTLQQLEDHHEAIDAILEKRKPDFKGC